MSNTFSKTKMENHTGRHPASFCGRGRETDGEKIARGQQRWRETHGGHKTRAVILRKKAPGRQPEASQGQCAEVI